ncbi:unnamed protein product [Sphagnum tenellum]
MQQGREMWSAEQSGRLETMPESMDKGWVGCRDGGYPCALWQLFHVLTVEQAHKWRWQKMAKMNFILYEFTTSRVLQSKEQPEETPFQLCNSKPFPQEDVCPLCYEETGEGEVGTGGGQHVNQTGNGEHASETGSAERVAPRRFRSGRVILRYLYAVYTSDKIL